ncbi:MAG: 30S ribosomal protein S7 [Candidatus Thermofonsia Clade 1 bacterium]|uniref:Small ribosomal subunit protein uS7 n=1 Tax=Candidatus Thermofonsia Clade 1 bacterium TaxID=2364210 RepID=A0A2M8PIV6_9CHLR|nr:MAG: 30S ribosomal protein S7 [Candidatus Thermofonsia Clade 1 bacterium]PJF42620.1 MAG: 30S ribosomal protein S7 [Candidatus Thermofonsia Clade 1 bacterium]RMF51635.1 MAG: 30S ribosomal protein S7 [Chloroflexota bacterium]
MPRRYRPKRRPVLPDIRYNSVMVSMFINRMMRRGKKSLAQRIFYTAMDLVAERAKREPLEVLESALRNATPTTEVKPKRVGGSTYQVPVDVSKERGESLAMRWLLDAARARSGRSMAEKLAAELMDAANNTGAAIKKKEETHRMAEANRAFAHYRW